MHVYVHDGKKKTRLSKSLDSLAKRIISRKVHIDFITNLLQRLICLIWKTEISRKLKPRDDETRRGKSRSESCP